MFGLILLAAVSFAKPFPDGAVPQCDAAVDPKRDCSIDAYGANASGCGRLIAMMFMIGDSGKKGK